MKNKLLILILSAFLTGTVFTSCNMMNNADSQTEDSYEANDSETDEDEEKDELEEPEEVKDNTPDASVQIEILAENADSWFGKKINDFYSYCVTDLDGNGRLEVISSGIGGTGNSSLGNIYEVNESFDGITPCGEDGTLKLDISTMDLIDYYIEPETGKLYYETFDGTRYGWMESIYEKYALVLENSSYTVIPIASCLILTDEEDYTETYYYYDADENEVDEEYYVNCYNVVFDGYEKKTASLGWQIADRIPSYEITDDSGFHVRPEYDELVTLLTESYSVFSEK